MAPHIVLRESGLAFELVRASTNGATMTVKLYGISDGRKVNVSSANILSRTPSPPPKEEFDPTLRPGERKQIDWAADGYRVNITRSIDKAGSTVNETLASNYKAWQAVYGFGPVFKKPKILPATAPIAPRLIPVNNPSR